MRASSLSTVEDFSFSKPPLNEDWYEQTIIEHLEEKLGYEYLYGPNIPRTSDDYRDVFLTGVLSESLRRINKGLPQAAIDEAILKINNVEGGSLEQRNEIFTEYLQSGIEVHFYDGKQETDDIVRLLDFDNPENNSFHVVNQWTFIEYSEKRPDVIIFVNGMPLVIFELKSPSREETSASDAYLQLRQYMKQIPSMFVPNVFCIMSDMTETRVGTITADEDRYVAWKSVDGDYSETKNASWKTMLDGMLPKARLLDIIQNFVCFNDTSEKVVKILGAYHQYFAVKKAIVRAQDAVAGDGKIGVFWHTQGSGKSLSMVFFAHLIQKYLESPTIVVITDRNDLDDQLFGQFTRCAKFLRQQAVQAESRQNLKELLEGREANGIIFTTMQKFSDGDEPLCDRSNVIVMVDEAHRGQYGLTEAIDENGKVSIGAARMVRKALPNASYIGFTGTPISTDDRNTREIFGDYIDVYDMTQSVEDESTKPVYYESRVVALHLDEGALGRIDAAYKEFADQADEASIEKSKHDLGGLDAIFDTPETIDALCRDIVDHYENNRADVLAGKALIVAYSRPIAMKIYYKILELRPEWKEKIGVVMTMSNQDPEEWFDVCGGSTHKKEMERKFKDDDDPLKIAIVVDMWLTGFDVPSLSTMYVFKPMKGHNLMQAIARVNRVCKGKEGGLVVDYIGIAGALKRAMKDYTNRDQHNYGNMDIAATAYPKFVEKLDVCRDLMYGFDYRKLIFTNSREALADAIAEGTDWLLEPKRHEDTENFLRQCQLMNQALSLCKSLVSEEDQHEAAYLLELATVRFEQELAKESKTYRFSELVELEDSKRVPLNSRDRKVRKGSYPYYGATSIMDYVDDYLFDGVRVLLGEDGTVVREDGKPVLQYVWGKYWVNNHAHILKSKADYSLESIYIALARTTINHIITGAVQMKISQKNLNDLELEMPTASSLDYLEDIFALYRSNAEESKKLEILRNALLPKLMSGEIDVSKVGLMQPANNHLAKCKAAALALSHIFSVACWGCGFLCNKVRAVICSHLRCLATFIRISVANEWLKLHLLRYV